MLMADTTTTSLQPQPLQLEHGERLSVEDCVCPICLDYFIDVVETCCHHRFCKFCLENWLSINFRRHCPTCRSTVGAIQSQTQLQESIESIVLPILSNEAIVERVRVRRERIAQLDRMSAEREHEESLLGRFSSPLSQFIASFSNPRRTRRVGESERSQTVAPVAPLLSRSILNWWDDNSNGTRRLGSEAISVPVHIMDDIEVDELPASPQSRTRWRNPNGNRLQDLLVLNGGQLGNDENRFADWAGSSLISNRARHLASLIPLNRSSPSNLGAAAGIQANESPRIADVPSQNQLDYIFEESLLEEYSYHLRRSQSAYNRVREGYRDFNYHNGRMQQILEEHRMFQSRAPSSSNAVPTETVPENVVEGEHLDYEDFSDLTQVELRELSSALHSTSPLIVSDNTGETTPTIRERLLNLRARVQSLIAGENIRNRRRLLNSGNVRMEASFLPRTRAAPTSDPISSRDTNVIDMEQEIQNRTNQLNGIFSGSRRIGSIVGTPRQVPARLSNSVSPRMFRPSTVTTPLQFQPISIGRNDRLRPSSAQHQLMVDRLTGNQNGQTSAGDSPGSLPSRRMRRRLIRNERDEQRLVNRREDVTNNNINTNPTSAPDIITTIIRPQTSPVLSSEPENRANAENASDTFRNIDAPLLNGK